MSSYRYPRDLGKDSFQGETFDDFSIPSWPSAGYYEDRGRSIGPTTASVVRFGGQCYPFEQSGIPNTCLSGYTLRNANNPQTEARPNSCSWSSQNGVFESRMDRFPVGSNSAGGCSFDFLERCDGSMTNNMFSLQTLFNDESQLRRNDFQLFQECSSFGNEIERQGEEDPLLHAYCCSNDQCMTMCNNLKRLFFHVRSCTRRGGSTDQCESCQWIGFLFQMHVQVCQKQNCPLPFCKNHNQEGSN